MAKFLWTCPVCGAVLADAPISEVLKHKDKHIMARPVKKERIHPNAGKRRRARKN